MMGRDISPFNQGDVRDWQKMRHMADWIPISFHASRPSRSVIPICV